MIAIEFQSHTDIDLFDAARAGVELIQDVLSAITVVLGTTFPASELVQVARFDDADHRDGRERRGDEGVADRQIGEAVVSANVMNQDIAQRRYAALGFAQELGALALDYYVNRDKLAVSMKGAQDFLTAADGAVEQRFRELGLEPEG